MGRANPLRRNLPRWYEDARLQGGLLVLVFSRSVVSDPVDCSPPGSSVHGTLHARLLERVAISFSRATSTQHTGHWTHPVQQEPTHPLHPVGLTPGRRSLQQDSTHPSVARRPDPRQKIHSPTRSQTSLNRPGAREAAGTRHQQPLPSRTKYCISDSFVDHDGYSISSERFLPTVVDIMVICQDTY